MNLKDGHLFDSERRQCLIRVKPIEENFDAFKQKTKTKRANERLDNEAENRELTSIGGTRNHYYYAARKVKKQKKNKFRFANKGKTPKKRKIKIEKYARALNS